MNILLASSKYMPEYSGSGFRAHNLYRRLTDKYEISHETICSSETDNSSLEYGHEGFRIQRIAGKKHPALSSNPLLRRYQILGNFRSEFNLTTDYMRKLKPMPDIIHIFGKSYVTTAAWEYSYSNNIPAMIELCNEMDTPKQYVPFPMNLAYRGKTPDKCIFVCISERLKTVCMDNGIPETQIWCRPNPVNEKLFHPVSEEEKNALREKHTGWDKGLKVLVYIAKFIPRKNHSFLVDVMRHLPGNYRMFLGGPIVESGPERTRDSMVYRSVENKISEMNLSDRVILKNGFFGNIDEYYKLADVYLFPTKEEGLGTPMLESISCGTPVVANLIRGITDTWIHDARNGYVSNLDPAAFARKIEAAGEIKADAMIEESKKLLSIASTGEIDRKYYEILTALGGKQ